MAKVVIGYEAVRALVALSHIPGGLFTDTHTDTADKVVRLLMSYKLREGSVYSVVKEDPYNRKSVTIRVIRDLEKQLRLLFGSDWYKLVYTDEGVSYILENLLDLTKSGVRENIKLGGLRPEVLEEDLLEYFKSLENRFKHHKVVKDLGLA